MRKRIFAGLLCALAVSSILAAGAPLSRMRTSPELGKEDFTSRKTLLESIVRRVKQEPRGQQDKYWDYALTGGKVTLRPISEGHFEPTLPHTVALHRDGKHHLISIVIAPNGPGQSVGYIYSDVPLVKLKKEPYFDIYGSTFNRLGEQAAPHWWAGIYDLG